MIPKRIVAEISKSYIKAEQVEPGLLCERFERVIAVNAQRGFALESWQLFQTYDQPHECLNETIVAVFVESRQTLAPSQN